MNAQDNNLSTHHLKAPSSLAVPAEFAEIATLCTATETEIGGRTIFGIADARDLHRGLKVKRDYTTWMKDRIERYGFREGEDFEVFTKSGENPLGGRPAKEYTLSLDMAKELAMVENNDQGRLVRRYFIWLESQVTRQIDPIEALSNPTMLRALLLQHTEERLKLEAENKVLGEKAQTLVRLQGADDLFGIRVTSKLLQKPQKKFTEWIQQIKWAYRQNGSKGLLCYADKMQAGYCRNVPREYDKGDGSTGVRETLKFTMKGVVRLAALANIALSEADLVAARGED